MNVWPAEVSLSPNCRSSKRKKVSLGEMSPRTAYIEKLRRIASREKGMRRAFLLAKVRQAEAESDEQFCKRMRVNPLPGALRAASNGRSSSNGDSPGSPEVPPALSNGAAGAHRAPTAHPALDADGGKGRGDAPPVARPPLEAGEPDRR